MLRGGITCAADMYFFPDAAARALDTAGMRALVGMPVLDFPTPYAADPDDYLRKGLAARDAFKHAVRLAFALAPHAPYTVSDATFAKVDDVRAPARPADPHPRRGDARRSRRRASTRAAKRRVQRLDRLGVTGPSLIAVHAVHLSDSRHRHARGATLPRRPLPGSNMKLASGIAPVAALLARDVNVALGTDGAASNNRLDLFAEMRLASLLAKVATGDAAALPAATALRMATLGGARAPWAWTRESDRSAAGKAADVVAVDLGGLDAVPVYDPVSHLVNVAGRDDVTDVWIGGERIVRHARVGRLVDEAALAARAAAWQQRLC